MGKLSHMEKRQSEEIILKVERLKKYFPITAGFFKKTVGWIRAVDEVSFTVAKGEIFGLVGESGCGKSTLAKTVLGICRPDEGWVDFNGERISTLAPKEAKQTRKQIQYVYQDPGASLDPWWTTGRSLKEPMIIHTEMTHVEMDKRIRDILRDVGLEPEHMFRYPHEFSGGQQRRLGLARILTINPSFIFFDEPTAGLDVSVQATILKLLKDIKKRRGLTYIIISHDLGVIRMMCHRVAVMYLGRIAEMGSTGSIFNSPQHPYTQALMAAIPKPVVDPHAEDIILEGEPPRPDVFMPGCQFEPRCPVKSSKCIDERPRLQEIEPNHWVACNRLRS